MTVGSGKREEAKSNGDHLQPIPLLIPIWACPVFFVPTLTLRSVIFMITWRKIIGLTQSETNHDLKKMSQGLLI